MKFLALASVTLGLLAVYSPVEAARAHAKKPKVLPSIIHERVSARPKIPTHAILNAETQVLASNPRLPKNSPQKGGFGLNSTAPAIIMKDSSLPTASTSQVSDLTTYMRLSNSAYCSNICPKDLWSCRTCDNGYSLIKTFVAGLDINGYVARNDAKNEIELVFRGSYSLKNWVIDLSFAKKPYPPVSGASVHTGFYDGYMSTQSVVLSTVLSQLTQFPNYKVVVTGHSLGGALATVAVLDLFQRDMRLTPQNLSIYTFGGPRVGDSNFAYYFASTGISLKRTINNRDIVPHLPPQSLGFLHPGTEYWIHNNEVDICSSSFDSSSCSNSVVPFTNIFDHLDYFGLSIGC
ncbi:Alpha/Beta hydrolase protein [Spinellus fusiger]|nr:Alpha/Beta hydrolase protein [Spinellus fusiger]